MKKFFLLVFFLFLVFRVPVFGSEIDNCHDSGCFQNLIDKYEQKIIEAQSQKKTLAGEISIADSKISQANVKIAAGEEKIGKLSNQISQVSDKIGSIEGSLDRVSQILVHRIEKTYIIGRADPIIFLLSSSNFSDFISRLESLKIAQKHDKSLMEQMAVSKKNYREQKDILGEKKTQVEMVKVQLENDRKSLAQLKASKQILLEQTRNSETEYQKLLSQAQAQLTAFNSFVVSQGGAGLLSNQTKCDDWGCYYNQRDNKWGSISLNHTGYTLADSGCLVSSMAMVITHYGSRDVNPITINFNPLNFASYYPAYLNKEIYAAGATWSRELVSRSAMDSELNSGPLVVGVGRGPDHFVVVTKGSNGNYTMNDPYVENGAGIPFTSKYSLSSINTIERVRKK
jgi:peptidoglycan hydrolase CwlO-like protein